jgi:hypothetical protein
LLSNTKLKNANAMGSPQKKHQSMDSPHEACLLPVLTTGTSTKHLISHLLSHTWYTTQKVASALPTNYLKLTSWQIFEVTW